MEGTGTIIPAQRGFRGSAPFPSARNHSGFRFPFSQRDYRAAGAGGGEPGEWFVFDLAQQFHLCECPTGALLGGSRKPSVLEVT